MESFIIHHGKSALNRMAGLWSEGFKTGLAGKCMRFLAQSCRESFTGQLLQREPVSRSRTYTLLQSLASGLEKRLRLPPRPAGRLYWGAVYGTLPALAILAISAFVFLPWPQALGALGAVLAAGAVLYRVEAGLYLAVFILPFVPFKVVFLLSLWTLGVLVLEILTGSRRRFRFYLTSALVPLLLLFLVMFYATVTSVSFSNSAGEFLIPVTGLIYLLIMVNVFDRREQLDNFILCLVAAGMITAGYAAYEFFAGIAGVKKEWVDLARNPDLRNRAYAVFDNPNLLAQYLVLLTPLALGAVFGTANRRRQVVFALAAALFTLCLVLTYSRGGWLAFAAALTVFALFKSKLLLQALPVAGVFGYWFMPDSVLHRLTTVTSLKDSSIAYRLDTWLSTLALIKEHWITGVGLGRKAFARVYYTHMINNNVVPHAHNLYLQIISEFGILGLAVGTWLFLSLLRLGLKLRVAGSTYIRNLNAGIMGAGAGFLVHSLADYFLWYYKLAILIWMLAAVLLVLHKIYQQPPDHERNESDAG